MFPYRRSQHAKTPDAFARGCFSFGGSRVPVVWSKPVRLEHRSGEPRPRDTPWAGSSHSASRAGLLTLGSDARPRLPTPVNGAVAFVDRLADHSGATAADSHRFPFSPAAVPVEAAGTREALSYRQRRDDRRARTERSRGDGQRGGGELEGGRETAASQDAAVITSTKAIRAPPSCTGDGQRQP